MTKKKVLKPKTPDQHQQGICPYCGASTLSYGITEPQDKMALTPWECEACGNSGTEVCTIKFYYHEVDAS